MTSVPRVKIGRIYDPIVPGEGARVLVDRLWPRGISKERADLALWAKTVAPSTELRKWYAHDPAKFAEFTQKYEEELQEPPASTELAVLQEMVTKEPVLLLTASKALDISEAVVLQKLLS